MGAFFVFLGIIGITIFGFLIAVKERCDKRSRRDEEEARFLKEFNKSLDKKDDEPF